MRFLVPFLLLTLAACDLRSAAVRQASGGNGGGGGNTVDELVDILIVPSSVNLREGEQKRVSAEGGYASGASEDLTDVVDWQSDDTSIAVVNAEGEVTGLSEGTTRISASKGKVESEGAEVTVLPAVEGLVVPSGVLQIHVGEEAPLLLQAQLANGEFVDVAADADWVSSVESVAEVRAESVYGAANGTAELTATYGGIQSDAVPVEVFGEPSPDLEVASVEESRMSNTLTLDVTVENNGLAASTEDFWVDGFYDVVSGTVGVHFEEVEVQLAPGSTATVRLVMPDVSGVSQVVVVLDVDDRVDESDETNNEFVVPVD